MIKLHLALLGHLRGNLIGVGLHKAQVLVQGGVVHIGRHAAIGLGRHLLIEGRNILCIDILNSGARMRLTVLY